MHPSIMIAAAMLHQFQSQADGDQVLLEHVAKLGFRSRALT